MHKERLVPRMENIHEKPFVSLIYKNNIAYTARLKGVETEIFPHVAFRTNNGNVDLMIGIHNKDGKVITGFGLEEDKYGLVACLMYPYVAADRKATTEVAVVESLVHARRILDLRDAGDDTSLAFLQQFNKEKYGTLQPDWIDEVFTIADMLGFPVKLEIANSQLEALGTFFDSF